MENNKAFKENISDKLYNDLFNFINEIHGEKNLVESQEKTIKNKSKIYNKVSILSGTVGLITIGMVISNNYDIYKTSQNIINFAGVGCLAMAGINANLHKGIEKLRVEYRNMLYKTSTLQDFGKYYQFEEKLVKELNMAGIKTEIKNLSSYEDFREMRDLWKTSKNVEADLRAKTVDYVDKMVKEYTKPEVVNKSSRKIKPY